MPREFTINKATNQAFWEFLADCQRAMPLRMSSTIIKIIKSGRKVRIEYNGLNRL
jgi:hypothetical protein